MTGLVLTLVLLLSGWNRQIRLQQVLQTADSAVEDTSASWDQVVPEREIGSHDPNPYPFSASSSSAAAPLEADVSGGLPMFQAMGLSHAL